MPCCAMLYSSSLSVIRDRLSAFRQPVLPILSANPAKVSPRVPAYSPIAGLCRPAVAILTSVYHAISDLQASSLKIDLA